MMWDAAGNEVLTYKSDDITPYLHGAENDQAASLVSADSLVRQTINAHLALLARGRNIVIDGRDCGSVYFHMLR